MSKFISEVRIHRRVGLVSFTALFSVGCQPAPEPDATDAGATSTWRIYTIGRDGTTTSETWSGMRGRPGALAVAGGAVLVAYGEPSGSAALLRRMNGQDQALRAV